MESIIERGISVCFSDEKLHPIARNILSQSLEKVPSLQFLVLKKIMRKRMKKDFYAKLLYSLIFREPVKVFDFAERGVYRNIFRRIRRRIQDIFDNYPKKHALYQTLRSDPFIMQAVLDQNLPTVEPDNCETWRIVIEKSVLKVQYYWIVIAEIPHEDYDTRWANVFAKIVFDKGIDNITLKIIGDENVNLVKLSEELDSWITTFRREMPREGWEKAFETRGKRKIYSRGPTQIHSEKREVSVGFYSTPSYSSFYSFKYWGIFGNDQ